MITYLVAPGSMAPIVVCLEKGGGDAPVSKPETDMPGLASVEGVRGSPLTLTTVASLPDGRTLIATHYLSDGEDLADSIRERMAIPGFVSVSVSRLSKGVILDHLREVAEVEEVGGLGAIQ